MLALAGPVLFASAQTAPPAGWSIQQPSADGDNDNPRISIGDASVTEGSSGTTQMTFTVSRQGDPHGTSSVHYETDSGTAISGVDFAPASGQLSFPTGVESRTLTVDVTGDRLDEVDEVFYVNLSNPTGGHIVDGQGEGTITEHETYEGRPHLMVAGPGWEEVADRALEWALASASAPRPAVQPAD